jgi:4-hydroxy-3-methylbut-2-enyl diphosphate reductase
MCYLVLLLYRKGGLQNLSSGNSLKPTTKKVILASLAGFCYGVNRAVDLCINTKSQNSSRTVCVFGQLIHNEMAIKYLESKGVLTIDSMDEIPEGSICVIRSHGEGPEVFDKLKDRNVEVVDATCPDVKRVQSTAAQLARENYQVIIIGQYDHPEVIAIEQHVNSQQKQPAIIVSSYKDIEDKKQQILRARKVGVVVQTTKTMEEFETLLSCISRISYEVRAFNTICNTTSRRQKQAQELAKDVDFMVVVGSKHSSNTSNLAQICKEINLNTVHVENVRELKDYNLDEYDSIGVTAGASTPKFVIDEVMKYLSTNKGD